LAALIDAVSIGGYVLRVEPEVIDAFQVPSGRDDGTGSKLGFTLDESKLQGS
jgi:hypothetical protein